LIATARPLECQNSTDVRDRDDLPEGFSVQEIGRLIEEETLRPVEHGGSNDDLDLLTTTETLHLVVLGDITIETDSLEDFSDGDGRGISHTSSFTGRLHVVESTKELGESFLDEEFSGEPCVVLPLSTMSSIKG
jgi:hypothetical protein